MARALDTTSLPTLLAIALWPWIDLVEMAGSGMGSRLRTMAENSVALLRHEVRMTPPIETALMDALHASDTLARDLDRASFFQTDARTDALLALNALIVWLRTAHLRAGGIGGVPAF